MLLYGQQQKKSMISFNFALTIFKTKCIYMIIVSVTYKATQPIILSLCSSLSTVSHASLQYQLFSQL